MPEHASIFYQYTWSDFGKCKQQAMQDLHILYMYKLRVQRKSSAKQLVHELDCHTLLFFACLRLLSPQLYTGVKWCSPEEV